MINNVDCLVVGAGFGGLFALHRLRATGLSLQGIEVGSNVGGTWFWNRYPGAACDVESFEYSYSFDAKLEQEWQWSSRYASQPEILRYIEHVADRFNLRPLIQFNTRVTEAIFDEQAKRWAVTTHTGQEEKRYSVRYLVMATGCLSAASAPDIAGASSFAGPVYRTSSWPHDPVSFEGKRVACIGTGSSAIQAIPFIAKEAQHLFVFQRTPNFSVPASNRPLTAEEIAERKATYPQMREAARKSLFGFFNAVNPQPALQASEEEREKQYTKTWQMGGFYFLMAYMDLFFNKDANETAAQFVRNEIAKIVKNPETAEALMPRDYAIGTKRVCLDSNYFNVFNQPNVTLVNLRKTPIKEITPTGVVTADGAVHAVDALVMATGFDAMTGALTKINIQGRGGKTLKQVWSEAGPRTYLGLAVHGFPNFFTVTGPGSPSVISNMIVSIEQHVNWIAECIAYLEKHKVESIEATAEAQDAWVKHANEVANMTLFPTCPNSWYVGANIPGKPRVFMPYVGGVGPYAHKCATVAAANYEGFQLVGGNADNLLLDRKKAEQEEEKRRNNISS